MAQLLLTVVATMAQLLPAVAQITSPLETMFFKYPVVVLDRLGGVPDEACESLVTKLDTAVEAGSVAEYRFLAEVENQSASATAPYNYWVEVWYKSARDFVNNRESLVPEATSLENHQHILTTGIGTCKLCPNSTAYQPYDLSKVRHGYFINDQRVGKYPVHTTFQAALPLTAAEKGTLDYEILLGVKNITPNEVVFDTDMVSFLEVYTDAIAFDQHVFNVNETFMVRGAPNWFVDIGAVYAKWFQIISHSKWCSFCDQPLTDLWSGPYTNCVETPVPTPVPPPVPTPVMPNPPSRAVTTAEEDTAVALGVISLGFAGIYCRLRTARMRKEQQLRELSPFERVGGL